jgi:2-(1,2-epoxy-1,2-dihydrophenyl)acetyl-CoA isomerase
MSIGYQQDQGIATITIDRPEKKNAITGEMYEAMVAGLRRAAEDKSVRVVIFTGAGDAYTAGNDLKDFANPRFAQADSPVLTFMQTLAGYEKPVIAAVNGLAAGVGCSLATACDLVLAAESSFFGLAFVNIGLMPDGGSTLFVPTAVGKARALQMALLGERVEAQRALEWGLVNFVYPDDRLLPEANELVEKLAAGPTRSYASSKQALNKMLYPDLEGQLDLEAELQHTLARTRDFQEGVTAFVQKREPEFQGARRAAPSWPAPPAPRRPERPSPEAARWARSPLAPSPSGRWPSAAWQSNAPRSAIW